MIVKILSNMKKITLSMNDVNINQDNMGMIQFHPEHHIYDNQKYYPGRPVSINLLSLIILSTRTIW